MLSSIASFYNTYQTRILIFAVIFAVVTNIATIFVLFEQLEHESLCDQQKDFNNFVEGSNPPHHREIKQKKSIKSEDLIIPKPNKLDTPPDPPKPKEEKPKTTKKKEEPKQEEDIKGEQDTSIKKESSILDVKGIDYVIHDFGASEIKSSDWKYYLDYSLPKLSYNDDKCSHSKFVSHIFMQSLSKWIFQREYGWFIQYDCPLYLQTEYRPTDLVPHIYNTQCAPFYPSDIVYLLSQILTPSMVSIQYGFSLSTVWLTNFVDMLHIVDTRKEHIDELTEYLKINKFDTSNIDIQWQRMSKRYVQVIDPKKGQIIDLVVMERVPEYHDDVLKYIVSMLKENNGILVIKMSDEKLPENIEDLIQEIIPKYWLRYNSYLPSFLVQSVPFSQEQYLEQYNMTIWITRTPHDPCQT